MNKEDTELLEGAMRSAISANNGGGQAISPELIHLAMKFLPKLLQSFDHNQDVMEVQKESVNIVHEDIDNLSRRVARLTQTTRGLLETQRGVLEELRLMREIQSTIVAHLARVEIIDLPDDDLDDYDEPAKSEELATRSTGDARRKLRAEASEKNRRRSRQHPLHDH